VNLAGLLGQEAQGKRELDILFSLHFISTLAPAEAELNFSEKSGTGRQHGGGGEKKCDTKQLTVAEAQEEGGGGAKKPATACIIRKSYTIHLPNTTSSKTHRPDTNFGFVVSHNSHLSF
jgi:hypothetical protein